MHKDAVPFGGTQQTCQEKLKDYVRRPSTCVNLCMLLYIYNTCYAV